MAKTVKVTEHLPIFDALKRLNKALPVLWIEPNVPSLKNSKEIVTIALKISACCGAPVTDSKPPICMHCKKATARKQTYRLVPSKTVQKYVKNTEFIYGSANLRIKFKKWISLCKKKPFYVGMYFLRERDNIWDFNNATQIITDLFQQNGLLEGDDVRNMIPVYLGHHKDSTKPGVIIIALPDYEELMLNYTNELYDKLTNSQ